MTSNAYTGEGPACFVYLADESKCIAIVRWIFVNDKAVGLHLNISLAYLSFWEIDTNIFHIQHSEVFRENRGTREINCVTKIISGNI